MTGLKVTVPALTLQSPAGGLDPDANRAYARRAARTWLDLFLISGTIGGGESNTPAQRHELLRIWADELPTDRLLAGCWAPEDLDHAQDLGIRPISVLRGHETPSALLNHLAGLPSDAFVYSHPKYTPVTLTADIANTARSLDRLPAGGKICKVSLTEVTALRSAAGPDFQLYDGRCRHLASSQAAGATGVIAVPLAHLPTDLPPHEDLPALQSLIDHGQALIDDRPNLADRITLLTELLRLP